VIEILVNAAHWRKRAEEARTIADNFRDPETKAMMHRISLAYDEMAERAEAREKKLRALLFPPTGD
jgi:hypothetical protein